MSKQSFWLAAWNRALLLFSALPNLEHGVADCLQQIAATRAAQGETGEALWMAEQAVLLYKKLENPASHAASLGTLGDVMQAVGEVRKARDCYERGLTYWRGECHTRWTGIFTHRLEALEGEASDSGE